MYFWQGVLLIIAGVLGGMANSMAGGASLFTFPAMLGVGLSPITANATNSFGLLAGNSFGAYVDRERIPPRSVLFWAALLLATLGGLCGAALLLATTPRIFSLLVPALIGLATVIFAFSSIIRTKLSALLSGEQPNGLRLGMIFVAAIYNGFFGAGVGVIFLAVITATGHEDLRNANAFKNLLALISNIGGVMIFLASDKISWPHGLVLMAGAAMGGFAGGKLVKVLPALLVRRVITACGCVMTATYIYRFWL